MVVVEGNFFDFRLKGPCGVVNNLSCDVLLSLDYLRKTPFRINFQTCRF